MQLLGGMFEFESGSRRLLSLVDAAYRELPRHRLGKIAPHFNIRLQSTRGGNLGVDGEPPALQTQGGAGLFCGTMDAANFALVCPAARTGLVAVSRELLRFPYHARYELLEFAVFTLASRAQGLAPLHAGCVGLQGNGILLIGESGAGKSTLALQCLLQGMDFLAEDAVFVAPQTLLAMGVANFLHLREDTLRFIDEPNMAARIRRSPVICRRSGVEKYEIDLRHKDWRLAPAPLKIAVVVFVGKKPAADRALLQPLSFAESLARLAASQPYASGLTSWDAFARGISRIPAFELQRGPHPAQAALALRGLIEWGRKPR